MQVVQKMTKYRDLYKAGDYQGCEIECREVLANDSKNKDAWFALNLCLIKLAKWDDTLTMSHKALEELDLQPQELSVFYQLAGDAAVGKRDRQGAIKYYKKASDLAPGRESAHYALAEACYADNDFVQSEEALERIFRIGPTIDDEIYAKAVYNLSLLPNKVTAAGFFERYPTLKPKVDSSFFFFGVANFLARENQVELAVRFYDMGNTIRRSREPYDFSRELRMFKAHEMDLHDLPELVSQSDVKGPIPIFIVGVPRSGSSLLEQMLGAHSEISPLGEVSNLLDSIDKSETVQYSPEFVERVRARCADPAFCDEVRRNFFNSLPTVESRFVVDKTLPNWHLVRVIRSVFPESLVVHAAREKGPTIWSCYRTHFAQGVNYSESLEELSRYYDGVDSFMSRWVELQPDHVLRIQYEENVANPEQTIRTILDRVDLPFESACLDPSSQERIVRTASKVQVTQPIYKVANKDWIPFKDIVSQRVGL